MPLPLPGTQTTFLTLSALGVPPYSARGLSTSLQPISESVVLGRDWNGNLVDLSLLSFRKYRLSISGDDQQPPAIDGVWPGLLCTIGWPTELSYQTGMAGAPHRTPVAGSVYVDGAFTFYRPQFNCRIVNYSLDADEWEAGHSWTIDAEEV